MKVLLLGEFSSYHKFLSDGLEQLGHEVTIISEGDGWKQIGGAAFTLPRLSSKTPFDYYRVTKRYLELLKQYKGYDVVQFVSVEFYPPILTPLLVNYIKKHNDIISLAAVGSDYRLVQAYNNGLFEYYTLDYNKPFLNKYSAESLKGKMNIKRALAMENVADVIIPGGWEYWVGYSGNKLRSAVPFPVNVDEISYEENNVKDKIVFFHGLNREGQKGTPFIREAFDELKKNYPDDVEIVMDGHMPYSEYIKIMRRANVVVDQCLGYGYGINAIIAMAQGKIVLAGCRKEHMDSLGISEYPMVSIRPEPHNIYEKLEMIVKKKDDITEWGHKSREFVEKYHDCKIISKKYLDIWRSEK